MTADVDHVAAAVSMQGAKDEEAVVSRTGRKGPIRLAAGLAVVAIVLSVVAVSVRNDRLHDQAAVTIARYVAERAAIDDAFFADGVSGKVMLRQLDKMSSLDVALQAETNSYVRSDSDVDSRISDDLDTMRAITTAYYISYVDSIESSYDLNDAGTDYARLIDVYSAGSNGLAVVLKSLRHYSGLLSPDSTQALTVEVTHEIDRLRTAIEATRQSLQARIEETIEGYDAALVANTVEGGSIEDYRGAVTALTALKESIAANGSFDGSIDTKRYSGAVDTMIADYNAKAATLQAEADAAAAAAAAKARTTSPSRSKLPLYYVKDGYLLCFLQSDGTYMYYDQLHSDPIPKPCT